MGMDIYILSNTYKIKVESQLLHTPACTAAIAHGNPFFSSSSKSTFSWAHRSLSVFFFGGGVFLWFCFEARNLYKRVLEDARHQYVDSADSVATQRLVSRDFWGIANNVLNHNKFSIPPLFHGTGVLTSELNKANLLLITLFQTLFSNMRWIPPNFFLSY